MKKFIKNKINLLLEFFGYQIQKKKNDKTYFRN